MVFGLGEGKIEVTLEKLIFAPGETITGRVLLKLNNPKKARKLRVVFLGEKTMTQMTRKGMRTTKATVYSFTAELDGEKEYSGEASYDFKISVPSDLNSRLPNDAIGTVFRAVEFLGGSSSVRWYIDASLDVPGGFDVTKRVQISIS